MQFKLFNREKPAAAVRVVDNPEARAQYKKSKKISLAFIGIMIIIGVLMTSYLFFAPYDNGTISPAALSGNLNNGGYAAYNGDFVFYRGKDGSLNQYYSSTDKVTRLFDGDVANINVYDNFVYFTDGGKIYKSPYYGVTKTTVADNIDCKSFSVNGAWIYFLLSDGSVNKMMEDGSRRSVLVPANRGVLSFTADNRHIVYSTADALYSAKSDGTGEKCLAKRDSAKKISSANSGFYFTYSQDCIFYADGGNVKRIFSLAGGIDGSLYPYSEIKADVFNFTVDSEGAGIIYYVSGDSLFVRQMTGKNSTEEKTTEVVSLKSLHSEVVSLYCLNSELYAFCDSGELYSVSVSSDYKGTLKKIY